MNRNGIPSDQEPRFDDERVAREWRLQERALQEERAGMPMSAGDPRLAQYRLLSRALRAPVMEPIPYGFAAQVARRAESAANAGDRLERLLQGGLLGLLLVIGVGMMMATSANWLPALQAPLQALPQGSVSWGLVVAACCALTWGWDGALRGLGLDGAAQGRTA